MLSPRIAAAAFGAIATLGVAMSAAPANAAPIASGTALATQAESGLIQEVQYYGRPHYGPRRYYGRPAYRPRCWFVDRRVWTGYGWAIRPVRVCR